MARGWGPSAARRGSLMTAMLMLYVLMGSFAGFVTHAARMHKCMFALAGYS